ncbi:hypothetical protein B0O99DRAFT_588800 [Bisporella sp. PMI_857]|nr:hypothetical protein B0O99DRAFT_588800 [Bisporella sp. PMI_857]
MPWNEKARNGKTTCMLRLQPRGSRVPTSILEGWGSWMWGRAGESRQGRMWIDDVQIVGLFVLFQAHVGRKVKGVVSAGVEERPDKSIRKDAPRHLPKCHQILDLPLEVPGDAVMRVTICNPAWLIYERGQTGKASASAGTGKVTGNKYMERRTYYITHGMCRRKLSEAQKSRSMFHEQFYICLVE